MRNQPFLGTNAMEIRNRRTDRTPFAHHGTTKSVATPAISRVNEDENGIISNLLSRLGF